MKFYKKKTIKLGPFRFNFSKSGMGVSVGVKGFRIGTGPKGNYIHLGKKGIYYQQALLKKKNNTSSLSKDITILNDKYYQENGLFFEKVETSKIAEIKESSSMELMSEVNKKNELSSLKWISLLFLPIPMLFAVSFIFLSILDSDRKKVALVYEIDQEVEEALQYFYNAFNELIDCHMKWDVTDVAQNNAQKYTAGAEHIVKRNKIKIIYEVPHQLKTNINIPCIVEKNKKIYFLPDKLWIVQGKNITTIDYKDIDIDINNLNFVEKDYIPKDGNVLEETWLYVNKDGGPDKRFSPNPRVPVMRYTQIHLHSLNGLNEIYYFSKPDVGYKLRKAIESINEKLKFETKVLDDMVFVENDEKETDFQYLKQKYRKILKDNNENQQ